MLILADPKRCWLHPGEQGTSLEIHGSKQVYMLLVYRIFSDLQAMKSVEETKIGSKVKTHQTYDDLISQNKTRKINHFLRRDFKGRVPKNV